jgi:hypothetical protein
LNSDTVIEEVMAGAGDGMKERDMTIIGGNRNVRKFVATASALALTGIVGTTLASPAAQAGAQDDNRRITFRAKGDSLWSMNPDGTSKRQLTPGSLAPEDNCGNGDEEPAVSVKGELVFTRTVNGRQEVWKMGSAGGRATQLTTAAVPCSDAFSENPSWSPDGNRIIFTSSRNKWDSDEDLWIMNSDGTKQRKLFGDGNWDESEAFFSPDGSKIVFVREPRWDCGSDLWMMNSDGTNAHPITWGGYYNCRSNEHPSWSPDGQWVAFTSDDTCSGDDEVVVLDVNGNNWYQLTNSYYDGGDGSSQPSWSPDGSQMVFMSDRYGQGDDLYILDLYNGDQWRIDPNPTIELAQPAWGRAPKPATSSFNPLQVKRRSA